jgi:hypothetical protein
MGELSYRRSRDALQTGLHPKSKTSGIIRGNVANWRRQKYPLTFRKKFPRILLGRFAENRVDPPSSLGGTMRTTSVALPFLIFLSTWAHAKVPDNFLESAHQRVQQLLAGEEFGTTRGVSISETKGGKLTVTVTIDIGDSWGKESLAKEVAKKTMQRLYQSGLPISEAVVKVFSGDTSLIVLVLGKNQAEKIHWDEIKTGADFIDHLKSNYSGSISVKEIEDRCIVVEHPRTSRPSPFLRVGD